jgi:hypothetical protein
MKLAKEKSFRAHLDEARSQAWIGYLKSHLNVDTTYQIAAALDRVETEAPQLHRYASGKPVSPGKLDLFEKLVPGSREVWLNGPFGAKLWDAITIPIDAKDPHSGLEALEQIAFKHSPELSDLSGRHCLAALKQLNEHFANHPTEDSDRLALWARHGLTRSEVLNLYQEEIRRLRLHRDFGITIPDPFPAELRSYCDRDVNQRWRDVNDGSYVQRCYQWCASWIAAYRVTKHRGLEQPAWLRENILRSLPSDDKSVPIDLENKLSGWLAIYDLDYFKVYDVQRLHNDKSLELLLYGPGMTDSEIELASKEAYDLHEPYVMSEAEIARIDALAKREKEGEELRDEEVMLNLSLTKLADIVIPPQSDLDTWHEDNWFEESVVRRFAAKSKISASGSTITCGSHELLGS